MFFTRRPASRHGLSASFGPVAMMLLVGGCGGSSDSPTDPGPPQGLSVTLSPAADTLWIGETVGFTATAQDADGNPVASADLSWMSSDPAVATVEIEDDSVSVRAIGEGTATITALIEGRSGSAAVTVMGLQFSYVDAGTFTTCGLANDGTAFCWGANSSDGLLGVGSSTDFCGGFADGGSAPCNITPTATLGTTRFNSLSVGNGHFCGLDAGGAAYCWGVNNDGRLGTGDTIPAAAPEAVTGGLTFMALDAGGAHTCGLTTDGSAFCWGNGENEALGGGAVADTCLTFFTPQTEIPCSTTPVAVGGGLTFASLDVAESGQHTCALSGDGTAHCWGRGGQGQLGSGGTTGTPQAVPGIPPLASVSAGADHSCGVTAAGEAYCWGGNVNGQLGHGTVAGQDVATPPLPVAGGIVFQTVSAGSFYTCGVDTDGAAHCWGKNKDQQLGSGFPISTSPVPVFGSHTFASVNASWFHTCGFTTDDVAFCWGANEFGQLGTGTTGNRGTPARVVGQP